MSHKRFAIIVALCGVILFALPASILYFWSSSVGEGAAEEIVRLQHLDRNLIYLSGINSDIINYKLALLDQSSPDVVAVGSSRSMQVRSSFFKTSFVNLGGAVNSIAELDYVSSKMVRMSRKPKVVLLFVDVWWFNEKFINPKLLYSSPAQVEYLTLSGLRLLIKPLSKSGIVLKKKGRIGFGAAYQNQGYDSSGSFHYISTVTGETPSSDFRFQDTFKRIDTGTARFEYSDVYSDIAVSRFNNIIERLEKSQMHVLIAFPPFANAVYQKMMGSNKYSYIEKLTKVISHTHPIFDFTNPTNVRGAVDCEFLDGFHGGETIYGKLINQMAEIDQYLFEEVNFSYLTLLSSHGGVSSPETISLYGTTGVGEVDFLGLGCIK